MFYFHLLQTEAHHCFLADHADELRVVCTHANENQTFHFLLL